MVHEVRTRQILGGRTRRSTLGTRLAGLLLAAASAAGVLLAQGGEAATTRCLFISSYHQGYHWSDKVEQGLRAVLGDRCEIKQFDMDTKRRKGEDQIRQKALEAKRLVETWRPDIVITADDNAAKHVIQPFFKDHEIPFVFCGVNWTADEYGFPYGNVTGMIEVAPIRETLEHARKIVPDAGRAFYIGADTFTENKNLQRFRSAVQRLDLTLDHRLVSSTADWLAAYRAAQAYDFIILGATAGINDWDAERVQDHVLAHSRTFSVTNHKWLMRYAMLGVTTVPEEQGEWAGKTALAILDGMSPSGIPIVANSRQDIWINDRYLAAAAIDLPKRLAQKGKKVTHLGEKS